MTDFPLAILTPKGVLFDNRARSVVAPGAEGYLGILPRHAPMVCALRAGVVTVRRGEDEEFFAVDRGVVEVSAKGVVLLLARAERAVDAEDAAKKVRELSAPEPAAAPKASQD